MTVNGKAERMNLLLPFTFLPLLSLFLSLLQSTCTSTRPELEEDVDDIPTDTKSHTSIRQMTKSGSEERKRT